MELSIVIVNYNVKYFLEQCLHSVYKALKHIQGEVFVIDNNSVDGSCAMVLDKFPEAILIENKENLGFSKANNQGLRKAAGKYCLLLNPDTVVEEDSFLKCLQFMDSHPEAGALGVKMIDGKGKFLPESKRALPTPTVAFFKIFGLSSLFPRSRIFGRYHLGYLSKEDTHPVEILAGAFMFIRKEALDKTGLLDEGFFLYGEDIDLSYRLNKAGFTNYYFPETTIIHYKGESTKKGSINYVLVFYKAMIIFARKHFSPNNARILTVLIHLAIYFRAFLAIFRRLTAKLYQPVFDILFIYTGYFVITPLWEKYKFGTEAYYPDYFYYSAVPVYILTWILSIYLSGGYKKPVRIRKIISGHLTGTIIILVIYALLPEKVRFSRALILLGSFWGLIIILLQRLIFHVAGFKGYQLAFSRKKRQLIVGLKEEAARIENLLRKTQIIPDIIGFVSPTDLKSSDYIGNTGQLSEIIRIHRADEIVFCAKDISSREIIKIMISTSGLPVDFKIAPPESLSIIGSNSINTAGDLYVVSFNSIGTGHNKRLKRSFDIVSSIAIICLSPFLFPLLRNFKETIHYSSKVFLADYTWVSYNPGSDSSMLPPLKKGFYNPSVNIPDPDYETMDRLNIEYARDYKVYNDFSILWKNIFKD